MTKIVVVVRLRNKYDGGEWGISRLSCKHALCCIYEKRWYPVEDYVHLYLKKTTFIRTYKQQFILVSELHNNLQPTTTIWSVERSQTKKRKEKGESSTFKQSSSVICSRFDWWGHNKRTCVRATRDQEKKKAKGEVKKITKNVINGA